MRMNKNIDTTYWMLEPESESSQEALLEVEDFNDSEYHVTERKVGGSSDPEYTIVSIHEEGKMIASTTYPGDAGSKSSPQGFEEPYTTEQFEDSFDSIPSAVQSLTEYESSDGEEYGESDETESDQFNGLFEPELD